MPADTQYKPSEVQSTPARFVQLGQQPTPSGQAADGYGTFVTVHDLERLEREKVRERLEQLRPELIAKGVEVTQAKMKADEDAEALRKELHGVVGADGIRHAMTLINESIAKQKTEPKVATSAPAPARK